MHVPNFIIIGAMKSATSTLQKQLVMQPGIFMTDPKEPNFFSDDDVYAQGAQWYSQLYNDAASGDLLGEASTHYTKLPTYPNTIDRMVEYCGKDLKLIYVMRNPVDRLISHYIHEWSMGVITTDINTSIQTNPELISYSKYAYQLAPYMQAFGKSNILPVFYERLINHPQEQLDRVCRFIGYQAAPAWVDSHSQLNASAERVKPFKGYDLLVESPIATSLRRILVPKFLRTVIRKSLSMQERPSLEQEVLDHIKLQLNEDLAELGNLLGIHVDCDTFNSLSEKPSYEWQ